MEKQPKSEQREVNEEWVQEATKKWQEMEWGERQYWLAQIADEKQLSKMKFIMTYKHFAFDKIPEEYQKNLAEKWGLIK